MEWAFWVEWYNKLKFGIYPFHCWCSYGQKEKPFYIYVHYNDSLHKNKILNNEWNKYLFRTYLTPIKKSDTYTYYTIVLLSFTLCFTNHNLSHALFKKKKKIHMIYNSWWIFGTLLVKHKIPIPYRDLTQLREREREREREINFSWSRWSRKFWCYVDFSCYYLMHLVVESEGQGRNQDFKLVGGYNIKRKLLWNSN